MATACVSTMTLSSALKPISWPFTHLTTLNLSRTLITDQQLLPCINAMPCLQDLRLAGCTNLSADTLQCLSYSSFLGSSLTTLDYSHNWVDIQGLRRLIEGFSCLTRLSLSCMKGLYNTKDHDLCWSNLVEWNVPGLICLSSTDIARTLSQSFHSLNRLDLGSNQTLLPSFRTTMLKIIFVSWLWVYSYSGECELSSTDLIAAIGSTSTPLMPMQHLNLSWFVKNNFIVYMSPSR